MKGFWESVGNDTLRIVRVISFALALFLLFASAYLSGLYNQAAVYTASGMFFAAGMGSLCNAGITAQKQFRSSVPHLVFTVVCWVGALYLAFMWMR